MDKEVIQAIANIGFSVNEFNEALNKAGSIAASSLIPVLDIISNFAQQEAIETFAEFMDKLED